MLWRGENGEMGWMVKKAPPGDSISCYKSPHHISEPHYIRARITSVQKGPLQSAARYIHDTQCNGHLHCIESLI